MIVGRFEEEWESLTKKYEHGSFRYEDSSSTVRKIITSEFRNAAPTVGQVLYLVICRSVVLLG